MLLTEHILFSNELLTIRHAFARPSSSPISDLEHARADLILLPTAGLFARHETPKRYFIANANHGLLFACGTPYRISFPGGIGDECLVLHFREEILPGLLSRIAGVEALHSSRLDRQCLLPPAAVLDRHRLHRRLAQKPVQTLAIEELALSLLDASVRAAVRDCPPAGDTGRDGTQARRRRQVEAVKELISLQPLRDWTLGELALAAHGSPFHLARIFRQEVGIPIHCYLIRTRLGLAMQAMRARDAQLAGIAFGAGFSHHSHLSASFRAVFGMTPSAWRAECIDPEPSKNLIAAQVLRQ